MTRLRLRTLFAAALLGACLAQPPGAPAQEARPAPPTGPVAEFIGDAKISLTWSHPASASSEAPADYRIYRATKPFESAANAIVVATVAYPGAAFLNAGLLPNTTYYYRWLAFSRSTPALQSALSFDAWAFLPSPALKVSVVLDRNEYARGGPQPVLICSVKDEAGRPVANLEAFAFSVLLGEEPWSVDFTRTAAKGTYIADLDVSTLEPGLHSVTVAARDHRNAAGTDRRTFFLAENGFSPSEHTAGAGASGPDPAFKLGEVYAYPNPARAGVAPVFHIEAGLAARATLRVFNMAGQQVHEAALAGPPSVIDAGSGPRYAFESRWDGAIPSGAYLFTVEAAKDGEPTLRAAGKLAVVR